MQLDLEIGTTVQSWTLGFDNSLDAWLRRCPWRSGEISQMRTLRLASLHEADRIALEIRRLIFAADEGVYSPQVLLPGASKADGMIAMMTACIFGEPRSLDGLGLKRLILDRLEQAPHFFQLVVRSGDPAVSLEGLRSFIEGINREECVYPLIVLVLSEDAQLIRRPDCFDTVPAMPSSRVLTPHNLDPLPLWGSYLHCRAAWECAGDMHLAQTYGSAWKEVREFDDDALEATCSALAMRRWTDVTPSRKAELKQYIVEASLPLQRAFYGQKLEGLMADGLLWRPPGHFRLMPTAWAVRATAKMKVGNGVLQRASLVNSILVSEVVAWCFQLEAMERARYDDSSDLSESEEAQTLYANFVARKAYSAGLYPENYPISLSVTDFESFGWFCNRFSKNPRSNPRRKLLSLRNALCHGHYVGWRTIEDILVIEAQLSFATR